MLAYSNVLPRLGRPLAHEPGAGCDDRRILQVQLCLVQIGGSALGLRLGRLCPRNLDGNLLRPGFSVPYFGLGLGNLGPRLCDCLFRSQRRRPCVLDSRGGAFLGNNRLSILLLRDLILRRKRPEPVDIILSVQIVGFSLPERGLSSVSAFVPTSRTRRRDCLPMPAW